MHAIEFTEGKKGVKKTLISAMLSKTQLDFPSSTIQFFKKHIFPKRQWYLDAPQAQSATHVNRFSSKCGKLLIKNTTEKINATATQNPVLQGRWISAQVWQLWSQTASEFLKRQLSHKLGTEIYVCFHQRVFLRHFILSGNFPGRNQ